MSYKAQRLIRSPDEDDVKPDPAANIDQPRPKANTVSPSGFTGAPTEGSGAEGKVEVEVEEWAVETSCYLCYAQCVNFGVHGQGGGRPCAKGMADVIEHLKIRRRNLRIAKDLANGDHERRTGGGPAAAAGNR